MFGPQDDEKEEEKNLDEGISSEDTTEDEDSEDSDNSSNESDDSDDGKDEEARIREIMSDPRKLPKELLPIYKRMQAIMTKRVQAAKESTEKAEALDLLLQDPDIRELIEAKRTGKFKAKKRQIDEDDDSNDDDEGNTTSSKKLESMIREAVTEALNPVLTRERQSRQKEQQKEFEAFTERYPDWEMYKEDMYEIIKGNSNLSFVQAYRLAKSDYEESSSQKKLSKEELLERKKKLNTRKPNSEGSRGSGEEKKKKMTIWDAFKLAKKQSGYKG